MWKNIKQFLPPTEQLIDTKIDDNERGERNIQKLIFDGKLWWTSDRKMYVYYTPTHWK